MADLWQTLYDAGAELVLAGHDHSYERFGPQDAPGRADEPRARGVVVGHGRPRSVRLRATRCRTASCARARSSGVMRLDAAARTAIVRVPAGPRRGLHGQRQRHLPLTRGVATARLDPEALQVVRQHLPPPGPVVVHVVAPLVDDRRDALRGEDVAQRARVREHLVLPRALADDDRELRLARAGRGTTGPRGWAGSAAGC